MFFDFLDAKYKANQLDNVARELRSIAQNKLTGDIRVLEKKWSGEACDKFILKGNKLIERLNKEADSLNCTANTIRKIAEKVYVSEMNALEIAKKRNYK